MGLMKGAFVVFQRPVPVPTDLIVFQFNAESLTRRLSPATQGTTNAGNATRAAVERTTPPKDPRRR